MLISARSRSLLGHVVPLGAVAAVALVVGLMAPPAINGDVRALVILGIVLLAILAVTIGIERFDLLVLCGSMGTLVLLTAIHHRGLAEAAEPSRFYDTTLWRFTLPELLMAGVIVLALMRRAVESTPAHGRIGIEPLLILGLIVLGLIVGLAHGSSLTEAIRDARKLAYVGVAHLAVVLTATTPGRRRRLFATLTAAAVLAALGHVRDYIGGDVFVYGEFRRASVDVADFVVVLGLVCIPAAFLRLRSWSGRKTWWAGLLIAVGAAGVFVTFSRAAWCALPIGGALVLLVPRRAVRRTSRWLAAAVLLAALLLPLLVEGMGSLAWRRLDSLASPSHDPTVSYRMRESAGAIGLVAERPLLGLGFGVPFDVAPSLIARRLESRTLVHNIALWSAIKTGLPGLVLLLVILAGAMGRLARTVRRGGSRLEASLALGLLATMGMLVAMGMVGALLNQARIGFLLGGMIGMSHLLGRDAVPRGAEGGRS